MATGSTWRQSPSGTENLAATFHFPGRIATTMRSIGPPSKPFTTDVMAPGNDVVQANLPVSGVGTSYALAGNDFANQLANQYSIQHGGSEQVYLGAINGTRQSSSILKGGANHDDYHRSINSVEALGTDPQIATAIRANAWDDFTGAWDGGYPADSASGINLSTADTVGSAGADHAASGLHQGSTYMGKITIHHGQKGKPSNAYYQGRQQSSEVAR